MYISREIGVGDTSTPIGKYTTIMYLPWVFHGKVGDTKEVYGLSLGTE